MIIMTKLGELARFMKALEQPYVTFATLLLPISVQMMDARIDLPHPFLHAILPLKVMWMSWVHIVDLFIQYLLSITHLHLPFVSFTV